MTSAFACTFAHFHLVKRARVDSYCHGRAECAHRVGPTEAPEESGSRSMEVSGSPQRTPTSGEQVSRRLRSRVLVVAVPVAAFAAFGYARFGVLPGSGHPTHVGKVDPRVVALNTPHVRDYGDVPLPVDAPPEGALVRATSYADPAASGEHVAFEYPRFTIAVCSLRTTTASADACRPQDGVRVFRTATDGALVTTYAVSSKLGVGTTDALARRAVDFFTGAALAPRPGWMKTYVSRGLTERYGYGR